MNEIDLNADLGEGFGLYAFGSDDELLASISSANIACGYHAGDPHQMRATVERCLERGIAIGAHPGLPDRLGFGRREMQVTPGEASDFVLYQTGALQAFVRAAGGKLCHVKLHGALYHMASTDQALAEAIAGAVYRFDPSLLLFGLPGSRLETAATECGLGFVPEGFADRTYRRDGRLASRQLPGAVWHEDEKAVAQAISLVKQGEAATIDGGSVVMRVRTICLHGDTPNAAQSAKRIRQALLAEGIIIQRPTR
ncbi:LamB/YcsF family protein [Cohnella yongneupensis]|uniref:5-oxoprolinase subunit A n=1 Tax=Cohnella yongneupensis TaxID=425006 RepID=A0ABW0QW21_9BACL